MVSTEPGLRPPLPRWARWADAAAGVLLGLAGAVAWLGGRWSLGGIRISLSAERLMLLGLAALVIRHAVVLRPPVTVRLAGAVRDALLRGPTLAAVLPVWALTRPTVLLIGLVATLGIGLPADARPPRISSDEVWNLPLRWDAGWYMSIAEGGYRWAGGTDVQQNLPFFPAFPLVMRAASVLGGPHLPLDVRVAWAGTLVSLTAFLGALMYLYRMFAADVGDDAARSGVMLLASYPFAVFYSAAYTESLYLLGVAGAFYHFRRDEPIRSAAWALLVGLTRPNGWVLAGPLAIAVLLAPSVGRAPRTAKLAVAAMPIIGMLMYSTYCYTLTGRPFVWLELQRAWGRAVQGPGATIVDYWRALAQWSAVESSSMKVADALNAAAALFAIVTIWPVWRRFGAAYALFVAAGVLLPLANGGVQSLGRFSAVLFPSFFWLAAAIPANSCPAVASAFALGQGLIAVTFFTWRPPF